MSKNKPRPFTGARFFCYGVPKDHLGAAMPVSDKDHFEALRAADQRAIDLLARTSAAKFNATIAVVSVMVAIASMLVAISTIVLHRC